MRSGDNVGSKPLLYLPYVTPRPMRGDLRVFRLSVRYEVLVYNLRDDFWFQIGCGRTRVNKNRRDRQEERMECKFDEKEGWEWSENGLLQHCRRDRHCRKSNNNNNSYGRNRRGIWEKQVGHSVLRIEKKGNEGASELLTRSARRMDNERIWVGNGAWNGSTAWHSCDALHGPSEASYFRIRKEETNRTYRINLFRMRGGNGKKPTGKWVADAFSFDCASRKRIVFVKSTCRLLHDILTSSSSVPSNHT